MAKEKTNRADRIAKQAAARNARNANATKNQPPKEQPSGVVDVEKHNAEVQREETAFKFEDVNWWAALMAAGQLLMGIGRRDIPAILAALVALGAALGVRFTSDTREQFRGALDTIHADDDQEQDDEDEQLQQLLDDQSSP